jgi:hypothetical protein
MHVGRAFAALEAGKGGISSGSDGTSDDDGDAIASGGLGLYEDYAIAQPTLEQVFVRTVTEHSGGERPATTTAGAGASGAGAEIEDGGDAVGNSSSSSSNNHHNNKAGDDGLADDELTLGIATEWCGLNRRSHCFLATAAGLLAYASYQTIFIGRIGYVFLPFLMAFVASVVGCAGCCCCIPSDPEEDNKD